MSFFLVQNTKEDILKNVEQVDCPYWKIESRKYKKLKLGEFLSL